MLGLADYTDFLVMRLKVFKNISCDGVVKAECFDKYRLRHFFGVTIFEKEKKI